MSLPRAVHASIGLLLMACSSNEFLVLQQREGTVRPEPSFQFFTETDLEGRGASVATGRRGPRFGYSASLSEAPLWDVEAQLETSSYEFEGLPTAVSSSGGGDLAGDAWYLRFKSGAELIVGKRESVEAGAFLVLGAEDGADYGDALMGGGYARYAYQVNESFTFRMGVSVQSLVEDSTPLVLPVLGHRWLIRRDLWLDMSESAQGIGGRLNWRPRQDRNLYLDLRYQRRDYRLDDTGVLVNGVLRDQRAALSAGASWTPVDAFELFAQVGFTPWGKIEVDDASGRERFDADIDPGMVFAFGGRFVL